MKNECRILIVEDEPELGALLREDLVSRGFHATIAGSVSAAVESIKSNDFDVAILDRNLPDGDGLSICAGLRDSDPLFPIIILTSRGEESERLDGFSVGADDYITKPFSFDELAARLRALLRRSEAAQQGGVENLRFGDLQIQKNRRRVLLQGKDLGLTLTEFQLISCLAESPGKVFTKEELLSTVWGYTSTSYERTLHSHINRLRLKLNEDAIKPRYIHTVWGKGYRFGE